jgi:hypothetical protein
MPVNPLESYRQLPRTSNGSTGAGVLFGFNFARGPGVVPPGSAEPAAPGALDAEPAVDTSRTFYPADENPHL